jgi:hypothetical protein
MANNTTKINETNNNISPQNIEHINAMTYIMSYNDENLDSGLGQTQRCGGGRLVNGIPSPLDK